MHKEELIEAKKKLLELNANRKIKALRHKNMKDFVHPYLLKMMSSKTTGELTVEGSFPNDENCLIVANHLSIEDIPTLGQAIDSHIYLLVSDEDKYTIDGLGLSLNGVEWVSRINGDSRKEAAKNATQILKLGNSFAMYPESTWNLSPNNFIMQMNYGCIRIALEAKKPIVPVVTFFSQEARKTIIGEKFYPSENLKESIEQLRDIMSTMVYTQIHEYYKENYGKDGIYSEMIDGEEYFYERRDEIDPFYWDKYVSEKYDAYKRAKKDKSGVREFESQFIFTPKTDDYSFFQIFNSVIREDGNNISIKRISSEKGGYNGTTCDEIDYAEFFGYGYNEKVLKLELKKIRSQDK